MYPTNQMVLEGDQCFFQCGYTSSPLVFDNSNKMSNLTRQTIKKLPWVRLVINTFGLLDRRAATVLPRLEIFNTSSLSSMMFFFT